MCCAKAPRVDWNEMTVRQINKWYREHDESHLWPICDKYNVTDRAIRRAQRFMRESGQVEGFEYQQLLESLLTELVNKEVG